MNDEIMVLIKHDSIRIIPEVNYFAFLNDPNCPNDAPQERDFICNLWVSL